MNAFRIAALLCVCACASVLAQQTNVAETTTLTIDGVTYQDVRWGRLTPSTATIYHKTGIATIPLEKLPPDLQKRFGYDPKKAAAYRAQEAQIAQQAATPNRDRLGQSPQQFEQRFGPGQKLGDWECVEIGYRYLNEEFTIDVGYVNGSCVVEQYHKDILRHDEVEKILAANSAGATWSNTNTFCGGLLSACYFRSDGQAIAYHWFVEDILEISRPSYRNCFEAAEAAKKATKMNKF
jgi:hypothetical protein